MTDTNATVPIKTVDCDIHPWYPGTELADYVPEPFRGQYLSRNMEGEVSAALLLPPDKQMRSDAATKTGDYPGSDPDLAAQQLFVDAGVDIGILIALTARPKGSPAHDHAMAEANNLWLSETWLSKHNKHGRWRGSIRVSPREVAGAVREIEKWAGHPHFVQVMMNPEQMPAFGDPTYHPIFEAAARHNLPVAIHVMRVPGIRTITPAGPVAYHLEHYPQFSLYYMAHLVSLIYSGIFDRFPHLKVVLVEGGYTWSAPLMWWLDNQWKALGSEVPHVKRPPSQIIREQVRFTTQPLDEPQNIKHLHKLSDWVNASETLMFATDYPHYDFDHPDWIALRLPREYRERVMSKNAIALYGLPETRARDQYDDARDKLAIRQTAAE